ncbi:MAG TPA: magnesium/cobalt transporter CorA [Acidimicrobiales bacterium]|nr:magnesium/cobalt transporter CorA [Acidimicrobiales bacterium]
MITVRTYRGGGAHEHADPKDIAGLAGGSDGLLWVDLVDPDDDDLACIQEQFDLHPLAIEDVRKHQQRPKLEQYPTHAFVVGYSGGLQEVDFFVGRHWLVSVRERDEEGRVWDDRGARLRFERLTPDVATVGFLLYVLLDELVDGFFAAADAADDRLEELEERIFAEPPVDPEEVHLGLFSIRRQLVEFRRVTVPMRDVVSALLRGEVEAVDAEARVHLQDVYDHVLRVVDQLDGHRELVGNAFDAYLAMISNRMNEVMKRMTSWGAILLGSTLVAGIYGMNFQHMPELGWRLGYPFALSLMALITFVGYRFFKRKDWL